MVLMNSSPEWWWAAEGDISNEHTTFRSDFRIPHRMLNAHFSKERSERLRNKGKFGEILLCSAQPPGWWTKA